MIIGINGKIGSGKDTVGKIIQWLTKPKLDAQYIGFQTYDDATLERLSPFKIKKFAGKLKTIASLLTGISVEKFEDQEFKMTNLSDEWSTVNSLSTRHKVRKNMTVRELLQKLGTEAMRDGLHENVWVNALFSDYVPVVKEWDEFGNDTLVEYPSWCITDMRFPNEMEAVKQKGGITIRVVRDNGTRAIDTNPHPSETALDNAKFDYEIINEGTIEDLVEKVREILIKENIIK